MPKVLPLPANVQMGIDYTRYPDHAAYLAALNAVKAYNPDIVNIQTGGTSYKDGYPLYYITIGDTSKPAFFFMSASHCWQEWYGANIVVELLRKFVDPADNQSAFNTILLQNFCVVAVPMCNPWGYYNGLLGVHHNGHEYTLPRLSELTWHSQTGYDKYLGVNLNRNFDYMWSAFQDIPFSVQSYWTPPGLDHREIYQANGSYNDANYFMMPYVIRYGAEVMDDTNGYGIYNNHILKPSQELYDGKGTAPFSEPETALVRYLVESYNVVGFYDLHTMNPWNEENQSMGSTLDDDYPDLVSSLSTGISLVNARNGGSMPDPGSSFMEDYGGGGVPFSTIWARRTKGIRGFTWETGTSQPAQTWTDAYFEVMYRGMYWMQPNVTLPTGTDGSLGTLALSATSTLSLGTTVGTAASPQSGNLSTLSLTSTSTLTMGILAGLSGNTIRAPSGSGLVLRGIDGHIITLNFLQ